MACRYWKLGIYFMGLLSFLGASAQPLYEFSKNPTTVKKNFALFNAIDVDGAVDVQIFGAVGPQQWVVLDPRAMRAEVKGGTLFLRESSRLVSRKRLSVKVYTGRDLNQLTLSGSASVAGVSLQSRCLSVLDASCGSLCLRGHIVLNKLISTGSGNIDIEWVDGNAVEVVARGGHIHLAGRADQLYAKLTRSAVLDTQYLRVMSAWVNVEDASQLDVAPLRSLQAFVHDSSTLGYYGAPKLTNITTQDTANVFWWMD